MSHIPMRVSGASMWPLLHNGQRVLVDPDPDRRLRLGDVLAVRTSRGSFLLHRLIELRGDGLLVTRGDSCLRAEGPFNRERVVGPMIASEDIKAPEAWRRPCKGIARILAIVSSLSHRRLARLTQRLLAPFAWTTPTHLGANHVVAPLIDALASDIEYHELGDELIVHDRQSGDIHALNNMARVVFLWSRDGLDGAAIVERVVAAYPDEDEEALKKDIEAVLNDLESKHIL